VVQALLTKNDYIFFRNILQIILNISYMLGFSLIKKGFVQICNGIVNVNVNAQSVVGIGDKLSDGAKVVTKITGATTGAAGLAKASVDVIEALACQDGVCAFISSVGGAADTLQIIASFVPGPNVTAVITTPVSVGCKVFVWCCKRSKLPWGGC
jgi:hypothetical protein